MVVVGFDTEDEAVTLANDSEFGLGAAIWTQDLAQAFRVSEQIDSGIVWINTHHRNDPAARGRGQELQWRRERKRHGRLLRLHDHKSIIINYASTAEALATDDCLGKAAAM